MMKNALQTQHDSAVSNLRNQRGRVQLLLLDLPLGHFGSSLHILPSVYNSHNHAVEGGENIVNVFLSLCYWVLKIYNFMCMATLLKESTDDDVSFVMFFFNFLNNVL